MTSISLENTQNLDKIKFFDEKFSTEKQKVDYFQKFSHFVQSSYGVKKIFKVFSLTCKWPLSLEPFFRLSPTNVKKIVDLRKQFKKASKSLDITKIFAGIQNAKKIALNYQKKDFKSISKKVFKISIKISQTALDILTFITLGEVFCLYSLGEATSFLKFSKRFFKVLSGSFLFIKTKINYLKHSNYQKIVENQESENARLKVIFYEIKTLNFLKLIKNISLVALNSFLIYEMVFQVVVLSVAIKVFLSTISLSTAIAIFFYKEMLTYQKV